MLARLIAVGDRSSFGQQGEDGWADGQLQQVVFFPMWS
jgi:hypothetical protein